MHEPFPNAVRIDARRNRRYAADPHTGAVFTDLTSEIDLWARPLDQFDETLLLQSTTQTKPGTSIWQSAGLHHFIAEIEDMGLIIHEIRILAP